MTEPFAPSPALETDLYHIDAAYIAWRSGHTGEATFDLFVRTAPFGGSFLLMAGVEAALDFVTGFRYRAADIAWLRGQDRYDEAFLTLLQTLRFTGEVLANPEGEIAFPDEPLLRVTAPLIEAILMESGLLRAIGPATLIATKAARMTLVAEGRALADFSLRRAHDHFIAARSSYIGGFGTTSFVDAARRYGIPASGTVPHALIQAFVSEGVAFRAVATTLPEYSLLLDTYDVRQGIQHAIEVDQEVRKTHGHRLVAVRIDSGDLLAQSLMVRATLDGAGLGDVRVLLSGDIDEYRIQALIAGGAAVDGFGVGGNLGVGLGTVESGTVGGVIGAVYKLVWYVGEGNESRMKLAGDKSTRPGRKQPWRIGDYDHDLVQLDDEIAPINGRQLFEQAVLDGLPARAHPTLHAIRDRAQHSLMSLPPALRELTAPEEYPVRTSGALDRLTQETIERIAQTEHVH